MFNFLKKDGWKLKKEYRAGNFEIDLESLKKKQLEILKVFIECCEKMNLKYYLGFGTLLGAIRHGGFIPWDDDIDVYMPREDYDVFVTNAQENLKENYFIQTIETDPLYALNFAKFRDSNTTLVEKHVVNVDINHGVFIDVFPLDGYINGFNKILDLRVNEKPVFEEKDTDIITNKLSSINKKFAYKIGETLPNKLKADISKLAVPKDNPKYSDCEYVACLVDTFSIIPMKKEIFGDGVKIKFEDIYANAPTMYDEYLKILYGDYMKLPPEEQRVSHHNYQFVDVNKSFKEYGEYIK